MFCKNCGKEIDDKAAICVYCGVPTKSAEKPEQSAETTNFLAIAGFVLSFFVVIAELICSIVGYKRAPELGGKGKGLAIAEIFISSFSMAIAFLYIVLIAVSIL